MMSTCLQFYIPRAVPSVYAQVVWFAPIVLPINLCRCLSVAPLLLTYAPLCVEDR